MQPGVRTAAGWTTDMGSNQSDRVIRTWIKSTCPDIGCIFNEVKAITKRDIWATKHLTSTQPPDQVHITSGPSRTLFALLNHVCVRLIWCSASEFISGHWLFLYLHCFFTSSNKLNKLSVCVVLYGCVCVRVLILSLASPNSSNGCLGILRIAKAQPCKDMVAPQLLVHKENLAGQQILCGLLHVYSSYRKLQSTMCRELYENAVKTPQSKLEKGFKFNVSFELETWIPLLTLEINFFQFSLFERKVRELQMFHVVSQGMSRKNYIDRVLQTSVLAWKCVPF